MQAVISIVSDFVFALFPVLLLWRIQIDLNMKVGLCLLMGLGFITGACCLVRTVINNQALPLDESYDGIVKWVWRTFEVQIGIIAACIPTLRPLYLCFIGRRSQADDNMGANVEYPLSRTAQSWVETVRKSKRGSRTHMPDLEKDTTDGAMKRYEEARPGPPVPANGTEAPEISLGDEMARFGIQSRGSA